MAKDTDFLGENKRGISPVVGVVLLVVITVVLAVGIGVFALGYGANQGGPAPASAVESSVDDRQVTFSVSGGDAFEPEDAEMDVEVTVADTASGNTETVEFSTPVETSHTESVSLDGSTTVDVNYDPNINGEEVTAGDTLKLSLSGAGDDVAITSYDTSLLWSPSNSSSQVLYSDTYSETVVGGGGGDGGGSVVSENSDCSDDDLSVIMSLDDPNPTPDQASTITMEVDSGSFSGDSSLSYSVTLEDMSSSTRAGDTESVSAAQQDSPITTSHDIEDDVSETVSLTYESFTGSDETFNAGDRVEISISPSNSDLQVTQFAWRLVDESGTGLCRNTVPV